MLGFCASLLGVSACDFLGHDSTPATGAPQAGAAGSPSLAGKTPEQVLASDVCQAPTPGRAPLRRLSNAEYRNTLIDLLGDSPATQSLVAAATLSFPSET
ncbi:MAG TPA: DUF1587 domain-containing protein, partial [Polyangiaceae bacterium]